MGRENFRAPGPDCGKLGRAAHKKTWAFLPSVSRLGKGRENLERHAKGKPLGDALAFIRGLADGSVKQKTWKDLQAETKYEPASAWSDESRGTASGFCEKVKIDWPKSENLVLPACPTRSHAVIHGVETAIGIERKKKC